MLEYPCQRRSVRLFLLAFLWIAANGSVRADELENPSGIVFPNFPNIVGGNTASDGEFPFLVRLYINIGGSSYLCGGALLSDTWVITAAHCLDGAPAAGVSVRAGSNQKSSGGEIIGANQLFIHPDYDTSTFDNDIALIELSSAVSAPKTDTINRLTTNESSALPEGSTVWVAGWGTTASGGSTSENLLKVSVNVSYPTSCSSNSGYSTTDITDNMLCASIPGGGQDACQGDSGGPLFRYDNNDLWLAGIVSWGIGCALSSYPGVYTRVANYDSWINQTMSSGGGSGGGDGDGASACVIDATSARTGTQIQVNLNSGCTAEAETTFDAAAEYWADFLYSTVKIEIDADFAPMFCTASGGVLGGAGPTTYAAGPELPKDNTYYSIAQANAILGADAYSEGAEISMSFNSSIGSVGCLENYAWYFDDGSAPSTPSGTIDLYGTILHEIGHGLGFLSLLDQDGSQAAAGYSDVYTDWLFSETMGSLINLSDTQRQSALISETELTWSGSAVDGLAATLSQGSTSGNVRMYAPNPYEPGSSVSHFDTSLSPNDLMEPYKTSRESTLDRMTRNLFRDIGWQTIPDVPGIASVNSGPTYLDVAITAPYQLGNTLLLNYTATCGSQSVTGSASTLRVSGLSSETSYSCSVTATTAVGESDASAVTQATTAPSQPPGQATLINLETFADEVIMQIALSSGASISVDQYVARCTAPDGTVVEGTAVGSSGGNGTVTVSGLQEGVNYSCEVYAENGAGPGGAVTAAVTVDGILPGLPIWLLYQATQTP